MSTEPENEEVIYDHYDPERNKQRLKELDIELPEFDDSTLKEEYRLVGHWECGWEDGADDILYHVVDPLLDEIDRLKAELQAALKR